MQFNTLNLREEAGGAFSDVHSIPKQTVSY